METTQGVAIDNNTHIINEKDILFHPEEIGSGTFGKVYKGVLVPLSQTVAVKKVFQDKRFKNRELEIMLQLSHPNIIRLYGYYHTPAPSPSQDGSFLNCVMEYVPLTLSTAISSYRRSNAAFPPFVAKLLSFQMLKAIGYLQSIGICHRDVKPQNIMFDTSTFTLKLCDFGCAKRLVKDESNINYICSRYYRPPELCLGCTKYSAQVDVWSMGCVIAEMALMKPLFKGKTRE